MQKMYLAVDLIFAKLTEPLNYRNTVFLHLKKAKVKKVIYYNPFYIKSFN